MLFSIYLISGFDCNRIHLISEGMLWYLRHIKGWFCWLIELIVLPIADVVVGIGIGVGIAVDGSIIDIMQFSFFLYRRYHTISSSSNGKRSY